MKTNDLLGQIDFVTLNLQELVDPDQVLILNRIYSLWQEIWEKVFSEKGLNGAANPDDFFRQHLVHALLKGEQVVGFIMGTRFDPRINSHLDHSYISQLQLDNLRNKLPHESARILSMEYLSVNEKFRKTLIDGISFGELLIGLSLKSLGSIGCDFAVGTPRMDIHVDRMASRMGMWRLQEPIQKYKYQCDVVASRRLDIRQIADPQMEALVNSLWSQQNSYFENNKSTRLKRVA